MVTMLRYLQQKFSSFFQVFKIFRIVAVKRLQFMNQKFKSHENWRVFLKNATLFDGNRILNEKCVFLC